MFQDYSITLNNVQLHYAEAPGRGPALLILHGLSGSHAEFLHIVPELFQQAHVYLLDLRGHGLSGWVKDGYQVANYGCDVAAFLEQVVGKQTILLGHSLGGLAALWVAVYRPHLIQGLMLEDPPLYIMQMPGFAQTPFYPYFTNLRDFLSQYHANGAALDEMVAYVGQAPVDADHTLVDVAGLAAVRQRAIQLHHLDPAILEPALDGTLLGRDEPDELLSQVACPLHLVAAQPALGGAIDAQDVRRAVAQLPHATYRIIEDTGHDIHLDQPQIFVHELKQFLAAVQAC